MYSFLVYLCAMWLSRTESSVAVKVAGAVPMVLFALAIIAVPVALHYVDFGEIPAWTLGCIYISAGVLSVGGVCGLWEILHNRTSHGAVTMSWAIIATVAMATTAIPYFNPQLGYKCLCEKARTLGVDNYAYYKFKYAENMDVFLGKAPQRIDSVAQLEAVGEPTVLFVDKREPRRDKEFAAWLAQREPVAQVGEYRIFVTGEKQ